MPWVPPYFGSWEQLIQEELGNPLLATGGGGIPPVTYWNTPELLRINRSRARSDPMPGIATSNPMPGIVGTLVGLVSLKLAASQLKNGAAKTALLGSIDSSIAADIDDICPPRPWPGPPTWVLNVVSTLVFVANTFQEGTLQTEIKGLATQILQRSLQAGTEE